MAGGIGTPALASSGGGGGGSSTITSLLGITSAGQATMANSLPVVIASNQSAVPVSLSGNQAVNLTQVGGSSISIGQQLAAASLPVILPSATITTLTPPSNTGYALDSSLSTIDTDLKSNITLHAGSNNIGVIDIADTAGNKLTTNSTTFTSKFALDVNLLGTLGTAFTTAGLVDIKGTDGNVFVRQTTASNLNAQVVGNAASGASVTGNPLQVSGQAITALPTAVSNGQVVEGSLDKFGRIIVLPQGMRDIVNPITQLTLNATTSETTLIAAVASTFNDLLSLVIINTSSTASQVDFRDSTGGTIRLSLYVPPTDTRGIVFQVPMPQNAVNNNWTAKCGTSVTSIIITGQYIANK